MLANLFFCDSGFRTFVFLLVLFFTILTKILFATG